jgi:hypothetical protein
MTMTVPDTTAEDLPELSYPRIVTLATDSIVTADPPLKWSVGAGHPLEAGFQVVAMYVNGAAVEIYSVSQHLRRGARNLIPMHHVRLIREDMPLDVFGDELARSEMGEDDEEEEEPELEPEDPPTATSPNAV